jgi:pimeloyl-ACP methyl ester carboxylesterase
MSDDPQPDRRGFFVAVATTLAPTRLGRTIAARPSAGTSSRAKGTARDGRLRAAFASLKQVDAGLLNVGYAEAGPADGRPVILLHGWRYDIHSYVDVAPLLAAQGYRVNVPHLRGHGTVSEAPVIGVPSITVAIEFDGAAADGKALAKRFSGRHSHRILEGIGHDVPQEAPQAFAQAIIDVDRQGGIS